MKYLFILLLILNCNSVPEESYTYQQADSMVYNPSSKNSFERDYSYFRPYSSSNRNYHYYRKGGRDLTPAELSNNWNSGRNRFGNVRHQNQNLNPPSFPIK